MESWKIAAVSGVLVALGVNHAQEPTIDAALAYPVSDKSAQTALIADRSESVVGFAAAAEFSEEKYDRKVTATFRGSSLQDILRWLTSQGVSFVADESKLPKDKKITLNVVDRPLKDVLQALATAMDGHWDSEGGMLVWRNGKAPAFRFEPARPISPIRPNAKGRAIPSTPIPPQEPREFSDREMKMFRFDADKMFKGWKEIEVPDGNGGKQKIRVPEVDEKWMEEFAKNQEKWARDLELRLEKDFGKDGKNFRFLKEGKTFSPNSMIRIQTGDPSKLVKTLSESQRKTLKERGYLKVEELTKEQRAIVGLSELPKDANISIVINLDGEKIEIRSK